MHFGQTGTGYVNPIQPIGDEDAFAFLAATRWPYPTPTMALALGDRCRGVSMDTCAPKRPDFYQRFPGSYPSGPIDPYHEPWPAGAKPYPGAPVLSNGAGGLIVPQPQLPPMGRGVVTTPSQALTETPALQANGGATGTSWWWLVALGVGLALARRR